MPRRVTMTLDGEKVLRCYVVLSDSNAWRKMTAWNRSMTRRTRKSTKNRRGVLSFEWVLLLTLLAIGVVAGLAGARDAIIDELGDVSEASISIDQSYDLPGIPSLGVPGSVYTDVKPLFVDGVRASVPTGQPGSFDVDS